MEHTPKTCDDCNPLWDRKLNVKAIQLCPLHAAAPELLKALENLFIIATEDGTREVSIREAEAILEARAAIKAAKGDA